ATSASLAPLLRRPAARAAPIPALAPVIRATFPAICILLNALEFAGIEASSHNSTMQGDLLPLFPLEVVLFPRTVLPLHIFEDRYKEMIGDVLREESEFGVVLARENGIVNLGCTAVVSEVIERHPDGRLDILTTGRRRFEVLSLNEERP